MVKMKVVGRSRVRVDQSSCHHKPRPKPHPLPLLWLQRLPVSRKPHHPHTHSLPLLPHKAWRQLNGPIRLDWITRHQSHASLPSCHRLTTFRVRGHLPAGKKKSKPKPLSNKDLMACHQDVARSNRELMEPSTPEFKPTSEWVCTVILECIHCVYRGVHYSTQGYAYTIIIV